MKNNLISVIIPTYNRSQFIQKTIESVLNQTYTNLEIIIIDDGSTDNTKALTTSIKDSRVKYVYQMHQGYPAGARNKGISLAKGDYIAFLDSDDLWEKDKCVKQIKILNANPHIELVCSDLIYFNDSTKEKNPCLNLHQNKILSLTELIQNNVVGNSSVIIRKEILLKIGLLDTNPLLKGLEDYDLWLRLLEYKDKTIYIIKKPLVLYREHETNISKDRYNLQYIKKTQFLFNKHIQLVKKTKYKNKLKFQLKKRIFIKLYHKDFLTKNFFLFFKNTITFKAFSIKLFIFFIIKKLKKQKIS